ncbi:MAG: DUF1592 domain-containing protein [Polyangiaceae bacterium]
MPMLKIRLSPTLLLAGALPLAACIGSIEERGGSSGGKGGTSGPQSSPSGRDPGSVTLHRLNRAEYDNTVRDLLGTALTPAKDFPADDHGYGYDNIADVLSISPTQVMLYEAAAETLVDDTLKAAAASSSKQLIEGETLTSSVGGATSNAYNLWSNGDLSATFSLPSDGSYEIRVRAWSTQAGSEPARMAVRVGTQDLGTFDVPNASSDPLLVSKQTQVSGGSKTVTISFLNDFYSAPDDRNLYVDYIEVEGPIGATGGGNAQRDRILSCDPASGQACQRTILEDFAKRAWRRPVTQEEIDKLLAFVALAQAEGDDEETGIKLALRAVLMSHNFLFRIELDGAPSSGAVRPLNAWELASRLSYFLWSSMPDDALFAKAESGALLEPDVLVAETRRMLQDPKAEALTDNFAGQWLYTRALVEHEPDANYFSGYDDGLRVAMEQETRSFFQEFLTQPHPVQDLLLANFGFVDGRLADHYGVSGVQGSSPQRVTFDDPLRGGLLGQASVLTITSYPTRTSPVKRGRWVLAQLLCDKPPDPPPGVEAEIDPSPPVGTTQKDLLAKHREDPTCASCHSRMDPIGIALENFDGIGRYRSEDNGSAVDPTAELPDGTALNGPQSLAKAVANDDRFRSCVLEQMFTYALGRGRATTDLPYFDEMLKNLGQGYNLQQAIEQIVLSEPFRMRRAEGGNQ